MNAMNSQTVQKSSDFLTLTSSNGSNHCSDSQLLNAWIPLSRPSSPELPVPDLSTLPSSFTFRTRTPVFYNDETPAIFSIQESLSWTLKCNMDLVNSPEEYHQFLYESVPSPLNQTTIQAIKKTPSLPTMPSEKKTLNSLLQDRPLVQPRTMKRSHSQDTVRSKISSAATLPTSDDQASFLVTVNQELITCQPPKIEDLDNSTGKYTCYTKNIEHNHNALLCIEVYFDLHDDVRLSNNYVQSKNVKVMPLQIMLFCKIIILYFDGANSIELLVKCGQCLYPREGDEAIIRLAVSVKTSVA